MDNSLYVNLSRQMMLRREMDIISNNIANADTTGFKFETLMVKTDAQTTATVPGGPRSLKFVKADGVARDFGQGPIRRTDGPLDVAIEGQGFFKVTAQGGDRYTRDGRFRTDEIGRLVTQSGAPVADEGGGEIVLTPDKGEIRISMDGVVSQGEERVGKIGVFTFDNLAVLEKTGDNLLQNASNLEAKASEEAIVRQGMLEGSNVQPIIQVTRMIEVSRAYEQTARMMESGSDLSRRSIERMGRVQ